MRTRIVVLITLLLVAGASLMCSPVYVARAGYEEAKILNRRQPIVEIVDNPQTPEATRQKLELVLLARTFAASALDLDVGDSYTTFSRVDSDTLALLVTAAHRDRFARVTWWFPIVGHVPYKGFFDFEKARRTAREMEEEGYDVYLRPTSAFSTLGWFNDPLLSTLLRYNDVSLASTVIHEVTHNTIYLPSNATFNESFASFVGDRGAIELFCGMEGEEGPRCRHARAAWADKLVFGAFVGELYAELRGLYARKDLELEEVLAQREIVYEEARERFAAEVQPRLQVLSYRGFIDGPLNNASLMARQVYYHRLDLFDEVYRAFGEDLASTVPAIIEAAEDHPGDPYAAVAALGAERPAAAELEANPGL